MTARTVRLVLNGKKAGQVGIRRAVETLRAEGQPIDVQVTWEAGDAARFAVEALDAGVDLIVAAGGDGTLHEVVNGIFNHTREPASAVAVVPLGSANDFAAGCGIPMRNPLDALRLAVTGSPTPIDVGKINDGYFVNALVVGFGAAVTFQTSAKMKKVLGGAAYGLTGFLTALKQSKYRGRVTTADTGETMRDMVFAAYSNGVQAGGVRLTPRAKLDDGKFDLCAIPGRALKFLPKVMHEIAQLETRDPTLIRYEQHAWMEVEAEQETPISPDGEELITDHFRVGMLPRCLPFVLPPDAPLVAKP